VKLGRLSDDQVAFQILENVRGQDVFVVQPTGPPVWQRILSNC
jgi:phosphoribosylpyrophosphate synthetase